jgi:hypothetical protein
MRLLVIGLILLHMAFAQGAPDEQIDQCLKGCCEREGGTWEDNTCHINEISSQDLSNCELQCIYGTAGVDTGLGVCCCAPAAVLMGILGAALKRSQG